MYIDENVMKDVVTSMIYQFDNGGIGKDVICEKWSSELGENYLHINKNNFWFVCRAALLQVLVEKGETSNSTLYKEDVDKVVDSVIRRIGRRYRGRIIIH